MPTIGQMHSNQHYLGTQHDSKPETEEDKAMSKTHKKHRKEIDKLGEKTEKARVKKLKKSIKYNEQHAKEHLKEIPKRRKELLKLTVK
jgi:hypothetical protein